jgi:hypothetical protein
MAIWVTEHPYGSFRAHMEQIVRLTGFPNVDEKMEESSPAWLNGPGSRTVRRSRRLLLKLGPRPCEDKW